MKLNKFQAALLYINNKIIHKFNITVLLQTIIMIDKDKKNIIKYIRVKYTLRVMYKRTLKIKYYCYIKVNVFMYETKRIRNTIKITTKTKERGKKK